MKIQLDIDCTPEEARAFLGLPDVAGIQNEMLEKVRDRMVANLKYADPQEMFRFWFPAAASRIASRSGAGTESEDGDQGAGGGKG